jgi:hypothetical protein
MPENLGNSRRKRLTDAVEKVGFPVDVMLLGGFSSARLAAISTQT